MESYFWEKAMNAGIDARSSGLNDNDITDQYIGHQSKGVIEDYIEVTNAYHIQQSHHNHHHNNNN